MTVHVAPDSVFTFDQNDCSRCSGICKSSAAFITDNEYTTLLGGLSADPDLDGSSGQYRNSGPRFIDADTDIDAIRRFLQEYSGSPNTLRTYNKEVLRYLLWCRLIARKPVSGINADDVFAYTQFIRQPPSAWCRPRVPKSHKDYLPFTLRLPDGSLNPHWRPFQGALSDNSIKLAQKSLKSLHAYLFDTGYTIGNPFKLSRASRKTDSPTVARRAHQALTSQQWDLLMETIDALPENTERQRISKQRSHYILSVFYFLGLRISEAQDARMNHFFKDRKGLWWLNVIGKGQKERTIPVPDGLLPILRDYRHVVLDMEAPYPSANEDIPLICSLKASSTDSDSGDYQPLKAHSIYKIVKALFQLTASKMDETDDDLAVDRNYFLNSTTHWLRHTYGTNLIEKGASFRTTQLNMGHSSIDTTMVYSHKDDSIRHQETQILTQDN